MREETLRRLKAELVYSPEEGKIYWRNTAKGRRLDCEVGTTNNKGYLVLCLDWERFLVHHVIWYFETGEWPIWDNCELDHKDGDTLNNKFLNLRKATRSQNLYNVKLRTDSTTGHRGVCWDSQKNKWKVQVKYEEKRYQAHFEDFELACLYAHELRDKLYGEFNRKERVLDAR